MTFQLFKKFFKSALFLCILMLFPTVIGIGKTFKFKALFFPQPLKTHGPPPPWKRRKRVGIKIIPRAMEPWNRRGKPTGISHQGMELGLQHATQMEAQRRKALRQTRNGWMGRRFHRGLNHHFQPTEIAKGALSNVPLHYWDLRELGLIPLGQELRDLRQWPPEPRSPSAIKENEFLSGLRQLCPVSTQPSNIASIAHWILEYSRRFSVDPFLLAALMYQQSRCHPNKGNSYGLGLTMINWRMHLGAIKNGEYHYWIFDNGAWHPRRLVMNRFTYTKENLMRPESNLYFAAALLNVFQKQCPSIDGFFGSVPHRHAVSHFIWGDKVRSAGVEDRILRSRRRLIDYYLHRLEPPLGRFKKLLLQSPIDGPPHIITSVFGDIRDGGRRRHTGIDFTSDVGEPVRAIADGLVLLAGVDWGKERLSPLEPGLTRLVSPRRLGPRGLLVKLQHKDGLVSYYMHLSAYVVRTGQKVKQAQLIGYVGRTGIKESAPHLHFGLEHLGKMIDPIPYLKPFLIPPDATYLGKRKACGQFRPHKSPPPQSPPHNAIFKHLRNSIRN